MCGERQSLRKVYSSGTGKDCRKLVQELNNLRFKRDLSLDKKLEQLVSTANDNSTYSEKEHQIDDSCASSKWSQFEDFGNQAQCENEENKVSPPRKRLKTSITQSSETLDLHFIDSVAVKKPLKRHLLYDNDDWSTSSVKYAKLNNTSRQTTSINMPMNKWLQYDSEAENNSNSNEHNPNNTFVRTSAIRYFYNISDITCTLHYIITLRERLIPSHTFEMKNYILSITAQITKIRIFYHS